MDSTITNLISNLEFGKPQQFKNMSVFPLFASVNHSPKYLTMKEAIEKKLLIITEVSSGGSVPNLKASNNAETSVLILAGEEMVGAKQNRISNTTILLKKKTTTIIPVSCTEQGRWSYVSDRFSESEIIAPPKIREVATFSVNKNLSLSRTYHSDQDIIWDEVYYMAFKAEAHSPTGAMRDIYLTKRTALQNYLDSFELLPNQKGLLVFINGKFVGFDYISYEPAYNILHSKFIKSYAMEALLDNNDDKKNKGISIDVAKPILQEAIKCKEKKFKSIGNGWDHRFDGERIIGSALVYRKKVVHMAFFNISDNNNRRRTTDFRRRPFSDFDIDDIIIYD